MRNRPLDILLVEPDAELAGMIQTCLAEAVPGTLTIVPDAAAALREELTTRHHVLVLSMDLPGGEWRELAGELRRTNRAPIFLLANSPSVCEVVEAMRLGVVDVLVKPFDLVDFVERIRQAGMRVLAAQRRRVRHRRLRRLTSRIIRERRDLRQRIDLICRDFVHAYRRLAQRVSEADMLSHK
jgi:DNA-binding response OmpR family regulator